ncbi:pyroglutamyl-peptidase I [Amycolatopsis marina]|nr:pyroglutamyl-peptidase I [Amycolatopsis marina]
MRRVLLTGFTPFGGEAVNPSWQAVRLVAQNAPEDYEVAVSELPCDFESSLPELRTAIERHRPELVVCAGQAGGRAAVTPERIAVNLQDARIPDNAGRQPVDVPVVPDGPVGYFSTLPVKACAAAIAAEGLPAEVSHTAGTFVCNHVFYGLMHLLATELPDVRGGFVHVPFSPEQAGQRHPSLPVEECARALDVLVRTALTTQTDLPVPAGTLH